MLSSIGQVWRRLQLLFAQGVATLVGAQTLQARVLDGELVRTRRIEPYGLSYMPLPGAQAYLLFMGGDRAQGVALVVGDKRYEVTLNPGEVALHDHEGNYVRLGAGGVVTIKANDTVNIESPKLRHNGVNIGEDHVHEEVMPGPADTGGPK